MKRIFFFFLICIPLFSPVYATETHVLNIPHLASPPTVFAPAITWFGKVSRTSNYSDVRLWYYDDRIKVAFHIIDRLVWSGDSVSLYFSLNGQTYQFKKNFGDTGTDWRGNGPNDLIDDKGWTAGFEIPFSSLGFTNPPPEGTEWLIGINLHDQDDAAGTSILDQHWPEYFSAANPMSWGKLRFGIPRYPTITAVNPQTITIRQGLNGAVVRDAHVGGHTICGSNLDHWSEWGDANYTGYNQINIQNQWDISDYPCFSKYFVTFPLTSLPVNKTLVSAKVLLDLFGNAGYKVGDAKPSEINAIKILDDWDEKTITWNNAPLGDETISVTTVNPVDATHPAGFYAWDVSRAAAEAYQKGQPLRLAFYSTDGEMHSGKYFFSSDSTDWNGTVRPALQVVMGDITYSKPCSKPGDTNKPCDNLVDINDYTYFSGKFNNGYDATIDLDGNGLINILDYTVLSNNFGK